MPRKIDRDQLTLGLRSPEEDWTVTDENRQIGRAAIAGIKENIQTDVTTPPGLQKPDFTFAEEPFRYISDITNGEVSSQTTTGLNTPVNGDLPPSGEPF